MNRSQHNNNEVITQQNQKIVSFMDKFNDKKIYDEYEETSNMIDELLNFLEPSEYMELLECHFNKSYNEKEYTEKLMKYMAKAQFRREFNKGEEWDGFGKTFA